MSDGHDDLDSERDDPEATDLRQDQEAVHRFVLTNRTSHAIEWTCPLCARHVRLDLGTRRCTVLSPGNPLVNHGGASTAAGLSLMRAGVERPPDAGAIH